MKLECSGRERDSGAPFRASLGVALLLALLSVAGCTQPAASHDADRPLPAPESTSAVDATSAAGGSVESSAPAPGPVPPAGSGVAPQAHGRWPPPCLALNYQLYGFQVHLPLHEPRGVQTEVQWHPDGSEVLFASGTPHLCRGGRRGPAWSG